MPTGYEATCAQLDSMLASHNADFNTRNKLNISLSKADLKRGGITINKTKVKLEKLFQKLHLAFDNEYPEFGQDIRRIEALVQESWQTIRGDEEQKTISKRELTVTDEEGNPAILVESPYSNNHHPKIKEIIKQLAAEKAEKMGIKAYETKELSQGTKLHSTGSLSSAIYSDAGRGLKDNGVFTITDAVEITLQQPK